MPLGAPGLLSILMTLSAPVIPSRRDPLTPVTPSWGPQTRKPQPQRPSGRVTRVPEPESPGMTPAPLGALRFRRPLPVTLQAWVTLSPGDPQAGVTLSSRRPSGPGDSQFTATLKVQVTLSLGDPQALARLGSHPRALALPPPSTPRPVPGTPAQAEAHEGAADRSHSP